MTYTQLGFRIYHKRSKEIKLILLLSIMLEDWSNRRLIQSKIGPIEDWGPAEGPELCFRIWFGYACILSLQPADRAHGRSPQRPRLHGVFVGGRHLLTFSGSRLPAPPRPRIALLILLCLFGSYVVDPNTKINHPYHHHQATNTSIWRSFGSAARDSSPIYDLFALARPTAPMIG